MKNEYLSDVELLQRILEQLEIISSQVKDAGRSKSLSIGYIDNSELLRLLNISERTAQDWRKNGTLKYTRLHRKIYYDIEEIKKMLKRQTV
jgi:hypothetical protein